MTASPTRAARLRVRVVVVNHDGGDDTVACLRSLLDTEWPAGDLEVVLVDNASSDGVVDTVRASCPDVRVIASPTNDGFGAGCNLGLEALGAVDHVALVNNDVTVTSGWLRPLADALESDPRVGAASPKILLRDRYHRIDLDSPVTAAGGVDRRALGVHLGDVRLDGTSIRDAVRPARGWWGPEPDYAGNPGQWSTAHGTLLVPTPGAPLRRVELELSAASPRRVRATSGATTTELSVGPTPTWFDVPIADESFDVINNVGTELVAGNYAADRGYLERDTGQYDEPDDVFAWCGAAVLLRGEYLREIGRFDESLFLYYEDVDLAWRGRRAGWVHRYVPTSVVRHVHSASASTLPSGRLSALKERNHLVVVTRNAAPATALRTAGSFVAATAGIARRDVLGPWSRGDRARLGPIGARVRAFGGYARTLPHLRSDGRSEGAQAPA